MLEEIIKAIREFFYQKGFHEVIIPIFHTSLPLEPNIYAFKVGDYYLPTSPEATLKKAIAKGIGNCFAIGHTFRDLEGISPIHNQEFLMLEWYREDADYRKIMEECQELILYISRTIKQSILHNYHTTVYGSYVQRNIHMKKIKHADTSIDLTPPWKMVRMENLFNKFAKLSLADNSDDKKMILAAKKRGYKVKDATWEQLFNQIFLNEIEPALPLKPFFLTDYPARISSLCAKRDDKPFLAERFELYINGIEIANGNTENTDASEVLKTMKNEQKYRKKMGILSPPIDMEFIEALQKMQGKSYAGIGLGVDRLATILSK